MELKDLKLRPPVVQIALDFATIEEALAVAKIGVEARISAIPLNGRSGRASAFGLADSGSASATSAAVAAKAAPKADAKAASK